MQRLPDFTIFQEKLDFKIFEGILVFKMLTVSSSALKHSGLAEDRMLADREKGEKWGVVQWV